MTRIFALALIFSLATAMSVLGSPLVYRGEQALFEDTVWSGEVLIDGILTIAAGTTLEIRPGTVVRFTRLDSNGDLIGEHELFIQGTLVAAGTADEPIRFESAEASPRPGDWGAINMMATEEGNRLEHCLVRHAYRGFHAHFGRGILRHCRFESNVRGLQFQESTVTIERCLVAGNQNGLQFRNSTVNLADCEIRDNFWGVRCVYSEVAMTGCRVSGNLVNGVNARESTLKLVDSLVAGNRRGVYFQGSRGAVASCQVLENSENGILLENSEVRIVGNRVSGNGRAGIRIEETEGDISGNDLSGNGEYGLMNEGRGDVVARGNWWGSADPTVVSLLIRDQGDLPEVGRVDFSSPLPRPPSLPGATLP